MEPLRAFALPAWLPRPPQPWPAGVAALNGARERRNQNFPSWNLVDMTWNFSKRRLVATKEKLRGFQYHKAAQLQSTRFLHFLS